MSFEFGKASPILDTQKAEGPYDKKIIGAQLDAFTERHGLKSLQDRLRIGLNEVAILAFERTEAIVKQMTERMTTTTEEAERLYKKITDLCVEMQKFGPWGYADELAHPESDEMKGWFMIAGAESIGYERSMDLNDAEFIENTKRIENYLVEAAKNPGSFFQKAHTHLVKQSEGAIRFEDDDRSHRVPIGEGFAAFLPMAIKGYESGVVQDAEGWVFVGARGEISDDLLTSIGLKKEVALDERDPRRMVTFFSNDKGQRVIKKIHPGLLVILSRSFDLASSIVQALNDESEAIHVAEDAIGHTRVIQTTEKNRETLELDAQPFTAGFLRLTQQTASDTPSSSTGLTRPRTDFYDNFLFVRSIYVYTDALRQLAAKRANENKPVTEHDRQILGNKIWEKMRQKIDELRYVNGILDEQLPTMPTGVRSVIDMAGGAGDLGLAVSNEFLSHGRAIDRVEIVDPQEGVANFMETIINYLPFRKRMEEVAVHTTGYLQDAHIQPDSIVVAKHACGTLTDAVLEQWRDSESPMLIAMTCCQGKAKGEPARYGFLQNEWDQLCQDSDLTNTAVPDAPGKARDRALERLARGNKAMQKMDMARVEYLRRHGFKAELKTTDKFPKGDVIIARRLPKDFQKKLMKAKVLKMSDPLAFDTLMMGVDVLAAGGTSKKFDRKAYGEDWIPDDFAELGRRFMAKAFEEQELVETPPVTSPEKTGGEKERDRRARQKRLVQEVFSGVKGRMDQYVVARVKAAGKTVTGSEMGPIIVAIKNRLFRKEGESVPSLRTGIDELMKKLGY